MRNIVKALSATRQTLKHAGIRKLRIYGPFDAMIVDFTEIGGVPGASMFTRPRSSTQLDQDGPSPIPRSPHTSSQRRRWRVPARKLCPRTIWPKLRV